MRKKAQLDNVALFPLTPPEDLTPRQRDIWAESFAQLNGGHLKAQDREVMRRHVRLVEEELVAFDAMVNAGRSRDTATHWRACVALVQASQRALRLSPRQRIDPRRAGSLCLPLTRDDGEAFMPQRTGDWRSLFPNIGTATPARATNLTSKRKPRDAG